MLKFQLNISDSLCSFKDLGNAIREGNLEFIRNLTKSKESSNSFCRMIFQRAIKFDISLRMNSSRKPERKSFHRLLSQKLEPKQIPHLLRYSETVDVTPFQLAILAQEKDIISLMLNSMIKHSEHSR